VGRDDGGPWGEYIEAGTVIAVAGPRVRLVCGSDGDGLARARG
jgi:hypothetical protein